MVINCSIGYITLNGKNARKHVTLAMWFWHCITLHTKKTVHVSHWNEHNRVDLCAVQSEEATMQKSSWNIICNNNIGKWHKCSLLDILSSHVIVDKKWCQFFIHLWPSFFHISQTNNKQFCHTFGLCGKCDLYKKKEKQSTPNCCWIIIFCAIFSILFW